MADSSYSSTSSSTRQCDNLALASEAGGSEHHHRQLLTMAPPPASLDAANTDNVEGNGGTSLEVAQDNARLRNSWQHPPGICTDRMTSYGDVTDISSVTQDLSMQIGASGRLYPPLDSIEEADNNSKSGSVHVSLSQQEQQLKSQERQDANDASVGTCHGDACSSASTEDAQLCSVSEHEDKKASASLYQDGCSAAAQHELDVSEKRILSKSYPPSGSSPTTGHPPRGKGENDGNGTTCMEKIMSIPGMNDIEPLPRRGDNSSSKSLYEEEMYMRGTPGAHAVEGSAFGMGVTPAAPMAPLEDDNATSHEDDDCADLMIALEAALVVEPSTTATAPSEWSGTGSSDRDLLQTTIDTSARLIHNQSHHERSNQHRDLAVIELVDAKPLPDRKDQQLAQRQRAFWFVLLAVLLMGLLIIIGLVLILRPTDDSSNSSVASSLVVDANDPFDMDAGMQQQRHDGRDTMAPKHYPPFQSDLPRDILTDIEDGATIEYKANMWMQNDPNLESYSRQRQRQRFALAAFYYATLGDGWTRNDGWLDYGSSECDWYWAYSPDSSYSPLENDICDDEQNILIFDLHSNNLGGCLTGLTRYYAKLHYFDVSNNNISGPPPLLASNLMQVFDVSNNQLEGSFVGDAGFAAFDLRVARIDGNRLSGNLSPVIPYVPKLEIFNMTSNLFHHAIGSQLQYATKLTYLGLGENLLTGTVPSELGTLSELRALDISGNLQVQGTLPSELHMLRSLSHLDVSATQVSGSIPRSFCERSAAATQDYETLVLEIVADCIIVECCHENSNLMKYSSVNP